MFDEICLTLKIIGFTVVGKLVFFLHALGLNIFTFYILCLICQELTKQLQKRVDVSSSNGHQMSPSASSTLVSVEGASNETPSEVNDSDVNIVQCQINSRACHLMSFTYCNSRYVNVE